tara:strand:+ start:1729 stop:2085 length:357 start_codon:yes stop_codon:yes gene_type:complete
MKVGKKMTLKKDSSLSECLNETKIIGLGFMYLGLLPINDVKRKCYMSKHFKPKDPDKASYFLFEHEIKKDRIIYKFHLNKNRFFKIENFKDLQVVHNIHAENDILSFSNFENDNNEID